MTKQNTKYKKCPTCGCKIIDGVHYGLGSKDTPEWTEQEIEICKKYDELVAQGKMGYRRVR